MFVGSIKYICYLVTEQKSPCCHFDQKEKSFWPPYFQQRKISRSARNYFFCQFYSRPISSGVLRLGNYYGIIRHPIRGENRTWIWV